MVEETFSRDLPTLAETPLFGFDLWHVKMSSNSMARPLLSMLLLAFSALPAQTLVGPNLYFFVDRSSFSAEGSWVPVNPKDHAANQTETELDCEKRTGECIEASADYYSEHPHISVVYFQVIKWDSNGIVATNADAVCVSRTISIGFAAKHISDTREAKVLPDEKQKACQSLGIPPNESWTFLLKNSRGWAAERDREHMQ